MQNCAGVLLLVHVLVGVLLLQGAALLLDDHPPLHRTSLHQVHPPPTRSMICQQKKDNDADDTDINDGKTWQVHRAKHSQGCRGR